MTRELVYLYISQLSGCEFSPGPKLRYKFLFAFQNEVECHVKIFQNGALAP